jgi:hypothetical protein
MFRAFVCCMLLPVLVTVAQDIRFGIKGGLNISDVVLNNLVNPDLEADYKTRLGPHAGVFALLSMDNRLSFAPEMLYSLKGVNAAGRRIQLHYVAVPLLVKYSFADNLRIEGGPEVGYLFLARSKYGKVNDVYSNNLEIAFDAGLEYLPSEKITFGLRFSAGFSNLVEDVSGTGIKYQNRVVQLSIGYIIGKASH